MPYRLIAKMCSLPRHILKGCWLALFIALPAGFGRAEVPLSRSVSDSNANVRVQAALILKKSRLDVARKVGGLMAGLDRAATRGATPREIGICLDALRNMGTKAAAAAPAVMRLLEEQSPVYRNLNKHDVDHLRAFLFVTLADIGAPKEALPFVVSSLAGGESWMTLEYAGAARAAGALGPYAKEAVPFLLRPLQQAMPQGLIAFEKFDSNTSSTRQYTTCQVEALRALRQIGPAAPSAPAAVRAFLERPLPSCGDSIAIVRLPDLRTEATATLAALETQRGVK
jgi:hypothetical protein